MSCIVTFDHDLYLSGNLAMKFWNMKYFFHIKLLVQANNKESIKDLLHCSFVNGIPYGLVDDIIMILQISVFNAL